MLRKNFPERRKQRRAEAEVRQAEAKKRQIAWRKKWEEAQERAKVSDAPNQ